MLIVMLVRLVRGLGCHEWQLRHRLGLLEAVHVPLQPMVLLSQLDLLAARRRIAIHQAQRDAQSILLLLLLLRVRLLC